MPGNNAKMIKKALSEQIKSDCIIIDLEDSVPAKQKEHARSLLTKLVKKASLQGGKQIYTRINQLDSDYAKEDLKLVQKEETIQCVVVPKVESELSKIYNYISKPILPIIETAKGFLLMDKIASQPGVIGLTYGTADLALSVGGSIEAYERNQYIKTKIAITARAYGLDPIDKVCFNLKDTKTLISEAIEAKRLGYSGKLLIHPSQVEPINEIFSPSKQEIEWAKKIVHEYEKAVEQSGRGAIQVNGQLIDAIHYKLAKRLLQTSSDS